MFVKEINPGINITYFNTYLLTYLFTYLFTYLLTSWKTQEGLDDLCTIKELHVCIYYLLKGTVSQEKFSNWDCGGLG